MQSFKNVLYLGVVIAAVVVITPIIWALFSRLSKGGGLVKVDFSTAVNGKVSERETNRHNYLWRLNGEPTRYDFGSFSGSDRFTMAQQAQTQSQNGDGLRYYLKVGDVLQKAANSSTLVVQRGDTVTTWTCAGD